MLTTIKGIYDHGTIVLSEQPPVRDRTDVIVTFLVEEASDPSAGQRGEPGALKGLVTLPDDFNEPLEDLRDYM